jgi:excinuclease ABC subunit A
MVDRVMAMPEGTRGYLLAPMVRDRKGEYRKELLDLRKQGFQRVKVDGTYYEIDEVPGARQEARPRHRHRGGPDRRARGARDAARRLVPHRSRPRRRIAVLETAPVRGRARADHLQREVRLPGVGLHHPRDRAAALFLQRALRRLPGLRRARVRAVLRRAAGRAGRDAQAEPGGYRALGQVQVALPDADHRGDRQALRLRQDDALEGPAGARAGGAAARVRDRGDRVPLRRGGRVYQVRRPLRGDHPQHGAPLQGDRLGLGARGVRAVPEPEALPRLRRLPAQARGAGREDRRAARGQVVQMSIRAAHDWVQTVPARCPTRRTRSRARSSRRSGSGWAFSTTWASNT